MKINEVEAQVGITKKNIRFYEAEGLLKPQRNSDNGYRDYSESDVAALRQIKLLRKLGLPLEEIRALQGGRITVSDAMRRHLVTLEREEESLGQSKALCVRLRDAAPTLEALDAAALLEEMAQLEQEGTTFMNKQTNDIRIRYAAPVAVTILMTVLMAGIIWLLLWAFDTDPAGAPPLPVLALLLAIPAAVAVGMMIALTQRIREIGRNELDDAKKY